MTTVGTDIIEVRRIAAKMDAVVARVLLPAEREYCFSHAKPAVHVAGRFAAKEAVFKALRMPDSAGISWLDIEIRNGESGAPFIVLHGKLKELVDAGGPLHLDVSISHVDEYAIACAICERTCETSDHL